jgi:hypothetical protein
LLIIERRKKRGVRHSEEEKKTSKIMCFVCNAKKRKKESENKTHTQNESQEKKRGNVKGFSMKKKNKQLSLQNNVSAI